MSLNAARPWRSHRRRGKLVAKCQGSEGHALPKRTALVCDALAPWLRPWRWAHGRRRPRAVCSGRRQRRRHGARRACTAAAEFFLEPQLHHLRRRPADPRPHRDHRRCRGYRRADRIEPADQLLLAGRCQLRLSAILYGYRSQIRHPARLVERELSIERVPLGTAQQEWTALSRARSDRTDLQGRYLQHARRGRLFSQDHQPPASGRQVNLGTDRQWRRRDRRRAIFVREPGARRPPPVRR